MCNQEVRTLIDQDLQKHREKISEYRRALVDIDDIVNYFESDNVDDIQFSYKKGLLTATAVIKDFEHFKRVMNEKRPFIIISDIRNHLKDTYSFNLNYNLD